MAPPPYEQPGADVAFWVVFGAFALGELVNRVRGRLNREGTAAEEWSLLVVVVCVVGGLLGAFWLAKWPAAEIVSGRWPVFVVGLVLMVAGVVIRQWAVLVLGRFFTVDVRVHSGQTVIDRGPYRWVRHPSYTGMVIFFLGLGLALTNGASLAVLAVVPTAGLVVRIRSEERILLAALGEPYRQFAATRRRLLPGVW